MNPSIAPVYMTATNMMIPIVTITNEAISNFVVNFVSRAAAIIVEFMIFMKSLKYFVWTEITNISLDGYKLFITGIILIAVALMFVDKIVYLHANKRVEELERQVSYMKKAERMRENDWELLMQSHSQSFRQLQEEFNKKFTNYDRQLKKIDKELKMYQ
jgi:hypothetical protein